MTNKVTFFTAGIVRYELLIDGSQPWFGSPPGRKLTGRAFVPYDPVRVIKDLLEHAVYNEARSDECIDAVENARGYLEQEASQPTQSDALRETLQNALYALESASGFILAKHGSYNPAREEAIAGLRVALQEQSK